MERSKPTHVAMVVKEFWKLVTTLQLPTKLK